MSTMENFPLHPGFPAAESSRTRLGETLKLFDAVTDALINKDRRPDEFAEASESLRVHLEYNPDMVTELETVRLPSDADADTQQAFADILRRVARGWPSWIRCSAGWHQLVLELDEALAAVEPGYELMQIREKDGLLLCFASPQWIRLYELLPPCCSAWYREHPDAGEEEAVFMGEHVKSVEHLTQESLQIIAGQNESGLIHRQAIVDSICAIYKARSASTCAQCGSSQARQVRVGELVRTLCHHCAPD
jgi:hypothetical protein